VAFGLKKEAYSEQVEEILHMVNLHMEGLLLCTAKRPECTRDLRRVLTYGIRITQANAEFGTSFIEIVTNTLGDKAAYPPANAELMCEALVGLCEHFQLRKYAFSTAEELLGDDAMETDEPLPPKVTFDLKTWLKIS